MKKYLAYITAAVALISCSDVNDERIPYVTVRIEILSAYQTNPSWWPAAPAESVAYQSPDYPYGFPYTISTYTGYGGVMVVCGYDDAYYAYDMACPVEREAGVRIYVDENMYGRCKVCGSTYDLFWGSGAPKSGEASTQGYGLRKYSVTYIPANDSYIISN